MLRSAARIATTLLCLVALTVPAVAKDKANKPPRQKKVAGARAKHAANPFKVPKSVVLTPEQQTKLDELRKQYEPKIEEAQKKEASVLSDEQKTLLAQAEAEAKQKIIQAKAEVETKAKITPEQAQQLKDTKKQASQLNKEVRTQVLALLTEEQKASMHTKAAKGAKRQKKAS